MILTLLLAFVAFCVVGSTFAAMLLKGGHTQVVAPPAPPMRSDLRERVDA